MRKLFATAFAIVALGATFATPASADCLYVSGSGNPLVTAGPVTVYAPGHVDTDPEDCIAAAREVLGI